MRATNCEFSSESDPKRRSVLPIHSIIKCRPPPLLPLVFIMAATELRDTDLEGQTAGTSHEFSYEQELSRVKSAGGVTISPELFERVGFAILWKKSNHAVVPSTQDSSCGRFSSKVCEPYTLGVHGVCQFIHRRTEQSFALATCTFAMILMGWGGATSLTSVVYRPQRRYLTLGGSSSSRDLSCCFSPPSSNGSWAISSR